VLLCGKKQRELKARLMRDTAMDDRNVYGQTQLRNVVKTVTNISEYEFRT